MKKSKKYIVMLTSMILAVLLMLPVIACAEDAKYAIDMDRKGSISITVANRDGDPVNGVEVSIFKVASVETDPVTGYKLVLTDDFAAGNFDLEAANDENGNSTLTDDLQNYVNRNNLSGEKKQSDASGNVSWTDLDLGLYFLTNTVTTDQYTQVSSFCVTLPNLVDDTYYYDVQARPKSVIINEIPPQPTPPPIPQTGQLWWPLPVLVLLGCACIILGVFMKKKMNADGER